MIERFLMRDIPKDKHCGTVVVNLSGRIPHASRCFNHRNRHGMLEPIYCYQQHTARLKVAHISAAGYVDFFDGEVDSDPTQDFWAHSMLYPSEVERLISAYAEWQENERKQNQERLQREWLSRGKENRANALGRK